MTFAATAALLLASGAWSISSSVDRMTDKTTISAVAKGHAGQLALSYQCEVGKGLGFIIVTAGRGFRGERYLSGGVKQIDFTVRADERPPVSFRTFGVGGAALIPASGRIYSPDTFPLLHFEVSAAKSRVLIRAISLTNTVIEDSIPMKGWAAAKVKVEAACAA